MLNDAIDELADPDLKHEEEAKTNMINITKEWDEDPDVASCK